MLGKPRLEGIGIRRADVGNVAPRAEVFLQVPPGVPVEHSRCGLDGHPGEVFLGQFANAVNCPDARLRQSHRRDTGVYHVIALGQPARCFIINSAGDALPDQGFHPHLEGFGLFVARLAQPNRLAGTVAGHKENPLASVGIVADGRHDSPSFALFLRLGLRLGRDPQPQQVAQPIYRFQRQPALARHESAQHRLIQLDRLANGIAGQFACVDCRP
ncbi:MAG: hypothetical protein ABIP55_02790 [Tepidisphaeraceae bacterium]